MSKKCCGKWEDKGKFCKDCPKLDGLKKKDKKKRKTKLLKAQ